MSGANQNEARRQARHLLKRSLPGSGSSVAAHIRRAEAIAEAVWRKWQVTPRKWQVKHLRWFLVQNPRGLSCPSQYSYWLTVRAVLSAKDKEDDWGPRLEGPWQRPTGQAGKVQATGRPPRLPGRLRS